MLCWLSPSRAALGSMASCGGEEGAGAVCGGGFATCSELGERAGLAQAPRGVGVHLPAHCTPESRAGSRVPGWPGRVCPGSVGSRAGLHLRVCEGGGIPSAVAVCWPMDGAGEPRVCLPARRPRCRGAAQPVLTSVLRSLPVFGSLLGTVMVAVGSLCTSPWFSPTTLSLRETNLYCPVCFLGRETEAGGREVAEPSPDPRHPQARSHASPWVVFSCQVMPRAGGKQGHPGTQLPAVSAWGPGAARLLLPPPGASLAWGSQKGWWRGHGTAVCGASCRAAR